MKNFDTVSEWVDRSLTLRQDSALRGVFYQHIAGKFLTEEALVALEKKDIRQSQVDLARHIELWGYTQDVVNTQEP